MTLLRLLHSAQDVGATIAENIFDTVTHVLIYRGDGQVIQKKDILCSFSGQAEQDMI
ncbi:hypothetical protein M758_UG238400 [Ceratodon purpureus]|nr:hypothetical protein M758_UG238400 [Ceratodon purpureus]